MSIDTVNDLPPRVQYVASAAQTVFPYPFPIFADADLVVDVDGVVAGLGVSYTVAGEGEDTGGNVTWTGAAMAGGEIVTIYRDISIARDTDISQNGPWSSTAYNDEQDKTYLIMQQLEAQLARSLRLPIAAEVADAQMELDPAAFANMYLTFDADGTPTPAALIAGTLTAAGIGAVLYARTQAEIDSLVTPSNYVFAPYNRARYATWANWKSACDQADAEGVVDGDWTLTANIELPRKCRFTGNLAGAFTVLYQKRLNGWVKGLSCVNFSERGNFFCTISDLYCTGAYLVDGFDSNFGSFWNEHIQCRIEGVTTIDITNFSVNLNTWRGGRMNGVVLTGDNSLYAGSEAHANTFDNVDFTTGGISQSDSKMQVNFLRGCYFEGGANIAGNFHVIGWHGDATATPAVSRFAHLFGATGVNSRLSRDFLSLSVHNLAVGGNWDILDSAGKPPSISHVGGASVSVAADSTEPTGVGSRYEASFSDAFDEFRVTIQPSGSNRFGVVIFYKSTADFTTVESLADAVTTSHGFTAVADPSGNDWKMLRISGPASLTAVTTVRLYAYDGTGGAAKVMSIGGVFAGAERAVISPQRPTTRVRYGSATYDPGSLADAVGATTTVTVTGAALGDFTQASFSLDLQGITLTSWVSAANTVSVRFQNESGGVLDLASGTLRVQVQTPYA
jgi:hypothetical protein